MKVIIVIVPERITNNVSILVMLHELVVRVTLFVGLHNALVPSRIKVKT